MLRNGTMDKNHKSSLVMNENDNWMPEHSLNFKSAKNNILEKNLLQLLQKKYEKDVFWDTLD